MGFTDAAARRALVASKGDLSRAANALFERPDGSQPVFSSVDAEQEPVQYYLCSTVEGAFFILFSFGCLLFSFWDYCQNIKTFRAFLNCFSQHFN